MVIRHVKFVLIIFREYCQKMPILFFTVQLFFDPNTRDSLGIELEELIVTFDEAHNVEDTLRETGSRIFCET